MPEPPSSTPEPPRFSPEAARSLPSSESPLSSAPESALPGAGPERPAIEPEPRLERSMARVPDPPPPATSDPKPLAGPTGPRARDGDEAPMIESSSRSELASALPASPMIRSSPPTAWSPFSWMIVREGGLGASSIPKIESPSSIASPSMMSSSAIPLPLGEPGPPTRLGDDRSRLSARSSAPEDDSSP